MVLVAAGVLAGALGGCAGRVGLAGGPYAVPGKGFRVEIPPGWERIPSGADLALRRPGGDGGLLAHATCEGAAPRRPLAVLARHFRFGLRDVQRLQEERVTLAGRPGLRTRFAGQLDGIPVEVATVTVVGSRCVYDLALVAPDGQFTAVAGDFARFAGSFALTEPTP